MSEDFKKYTEERGDIINQLMDEIKSLNAEVRLLKGEVSVLEKSRDFHQNESSSRQNMIAFLNSKIKKLEGG